MLDAFRMRQTKIFTTFFQWNLFIKLTEPLYMYLIKYSIMICNIRFVYIFPIKTIINNNRLNNLGVIRITLSLRKAMLDAI